MLVPRPGLPDQSIRLPLRSVCFLLLLYLYTWLRINPALICYEYWITKSFPSFSPGMAFFRTFMVRPGGPVAYASALLCQLYYEPWMGAAVITVVAGLMCLTTWVLISHVGGRRPAAIHLAPAVLLLLVYGRYGNPLPTALALVAAMLCVCLYAWVPARGWALRLPAFLVLLGLVYYVAAGAALMYAVLCGILELARERRLLGLLYAASGLAILCIAAWTWGSGIAEAYARLVPPLHAHGDAMVANLTWWLHLLLPFAALGMMLQRRPADRSASDSSAELDRDARGSRLRRAVESSVLLIVVAACAHVLFDAEYGARLRVEYYADRRMWPGALEAARRLPRRRHDLSVNWHVNRALYHTGRLPYEMFSYPQDPGGLWPSGAAMAKLKAPEIGYIRFSDILMDLGRVNEADHLAYEALALLGPHPLVLKRLAFVNIVKGRTEVARTFLAALRKDVAFGKWAEDRLRHLQADPMLSEDEEVARIRSVMVVEDTAGYTPFESMLRELLERNARNRMAFEYLMAHYLLTGRLDGIARDISRLSDFDYPGIPRHYEEALLLYTEATGKEADLGGREISPETVERFGAFQQTLARYGERRQAACKALAQEHGDSYFRYYELVLRERPE